MITASLDQGGRKFINVSVGMGSLLGMKGWTEGGKEGGERVKIKGEKRGKLCNGIKKGKKRKGCGIWKLYAKASKLMRYVATAI